MEHTIEIKKENLTTSAHMLSEILADEFLLCLKTRNAHWNIEGRDFHSMQKFFEEQYQQLDEIVDEVAERIRMLSHYAPATMRNYLELTHLTEQSRAKNDTEGFIRELLGDHESIIIRLKEKINLFTREISDLGTIDFVTGLMKIHEKMAWMLRAHIV